MAFWVPRIFTSRPVQGSRSMVSDMTAARCSTPSTPLHGASSCGRRITSPWITLRRGLPSRCCDGLAAALVEAVEDRHLAGAFLQQQLGGGRADQAGAADDQEAAALQRQGAGLSRAVGHGWRDPHFSRCTTKRGSLAQCSGAARRTAPARRWLRPRAQPAAPWRSPRRLRRMQRRLGRVLARRLAHGCGVALDVEQVVGDLESEADGGAVAGQGTALPAPARPRMAPASQREAQQRARLHRLQPLHVGGGRAATDARASPPPDRGICPPAMPAPPEATASPATRSARIAGSACAAGADRISNARVSSASPARIAVHSSKALCTVGRPRRRSSLSMAGRSSWINE